MQYPKIHPTKDEIPVDSRLLLKELYQRILKSERLGCVYLGFKSNYYPVHNPYEINLEFIVKPGTEEALKEIWHES